MSSTEHFKTMRFINYMRADDGELQGIDKSKSASIRAILENNALVTITKFKQVDGEVFPLSKFPKESREFEGLVWRGDERLLTKEDIFKGEAPFTLTKIEGIPLPEIDEDFFDNSIPDEELDIPEASKLTPSDLKNREEDAPEIGVPMSDKATIKKEAKTPKREKPTPKFKVKELPNLKAKDSTDNES